MNYFKVTVENGKAGRYGHHVQQYEIRNSLHNDSAVAAAEEALKTYRSHGHTRFPHSRGPVTVTVAEIEEGQC